MKSFKTSSVLFVGLIALGVSVYYAIALGFYPIAIVNGSMVSVARFEETEGFVKSYYEKAEATYRLGAESQNLPHHEEILSATLDKLISYELLYAEAKTKVGRDLSAVVDQKLASIKMDSSTLEKAVDTIYGLTIDRFKEAVLVPQAWEEIVRGRLFAEKTDFDEWHRNARKTAKVIILHPTLVWDGEKVVVKNRGTK